MFSDLLQQQAGYYFELKHHLDGRDDTLAALTDAEAHYETLDKQLKEKNRVYQKTEQETKKAYEQYRLWSRYGINNNDMIKKSVADAEARYRQLFQLAQKEKLAYECLFHTFSVVTIKKYELATKVKDYQTYQHQLEAWMENIFVAPHQETDHESHLLAKIKQLKLKRKKLIVHLLGDIAKAHETFMLAKEDLDAAIDALTSPAPCTQLLHHLRQFQTHVTCDYYDSTVYSTAVSKLIDKVDTWRMVEHGHDDDDDKDDMVQLLRRSLIKLQTQFHDRLHTISKTIQAYNHPSLRHLDQRIATTHHRLMLEREQIIETCLAGESALHPLAHTPAYHSDFSPPAYTTSLDMPRFLPLLE
ncbi:hypothetical protein BCR42DRAFT_427333 [Absidia repens]|uniref:Uncharacterized protein n=1 Tax=Absidia repens TaxID=90262 RepID=A0A1X2HZS6_9FUNG|nr:hypothetical protein BCR42DRAFT_427333 [Absidia repens]